MALLVIDGKPAHVDLGLYTHFHGHSVFTTLRSINGRPQWWDDHWQRLCQHAGFFGFPIPDEQEILGIIARENQASEQKIRVSLTTAHYALTFEPYNPPPTHIYRGVSFAISTIEVHPQLAQFKTGNSLPYWLAQQFAESHGAFEGLLINRDGFVVDGSRTSLMIFDGKCLTALEGGLRGIMREQALRFAEKKGYAVKRAHLKQQDLKGQLLLANCLIGVVPVGAIQSDLVKAMVDHFR